MGAFLVACLNTQLFKNCPESSWNNGNEIFKDLRPSEVSYFTFFFFRFVCFVAKGCADLRETTIKCPIIAPIPAQD